MFNRLDGFDMFSTERQGFNKRIVANLYGFATYKT